MRKLCRGTPGGQKIGKNLQMKLPHKKKKQTSENMANCFFAYSHLLTRVFADFSTRCESNDFVL